MSQDKPNWQKLVAKYQQPDDRIAAGQIANTVLPYLALMLLIYWVYPVSYWLVLLLSIPAAGFLSRAFVLFHDCGHDTLFSGAKTNERVGLFLSLFVWDAFYVWRHVHAIHHATAGDLDRRGTGDIDTWTVREYLEAPHWKQIGYRFYRHPLFLFVLLPTFKFTIYNRFSFKNLPHRARINLYATNFALIALYGGIALVIGPSKFLAIFMPVMWLASVIGLWLFYVQHQFEGKYWAHHEDWDYYLAAMEGSSFYNLPPVLRFFTANIGYHHLHHLSPKIPNYNLPRCHEQEPLFQVAPTITLRDSLKSLRFRLWDEGNCQLVGFDALPRGLDFPGVAFSTRHEGEG